MVLGRRFKLYFILCVWDRMSEPTTPPASYGNSNTTQFVFEIDPSAFKFNQPINGSHGPLHRNRNITKKYASVEKRRSIDAFKAIENLIKSINGKNWYYDIDSNHKKIKFLSLFQAAINENNKSTSLMNKIKKAFNHAKEKYTKTNFEELSQFNKIKTFETAKPRQFKQLKHTTPNPASAANAEIKPVTPGGSRHRNKKHRKHRTRKH